MTRLDTLGAAAEHPSRGWYRLRPSARRLISAMWPVTLHGVEHVPTAGPVIFASNHIGLIDGPLLAIFGPRPAHALTKREMFAGMGGPVLRFAGQISLDRFAPDPLAIKTCLRVLADDGAVGVFPEGTRGNGELDSIRGGATYLALVTGAPVVPVTMLGTRAPGAGNHALPPRGGTIDIVYGTPWQVPAQSWPRTREHVRGATALMREHMHNQLDVARALTGRDLPGPLPVGDSEDEPRTGAVDQGAS